MPLPHTIASLPDDPQHLKKLLADTYKESLTAKKDANKYKGLAKQYEELYDAMSTYNDTLKERLLAHGEPSDP